MTDAGVIHHPDNKSDHSPVYCIAELPLDAPRQGQDPTEQKSKPSCKRATQDQKNNYKDMLESKIDQLATPISITMCRDVQCRDPGHKQDLDNFTLDLLDTVQEVAELNLPMPRGNKQKEKKVIPGWREEVKPYREKAYL